MAGLGALAYLGWWEFAERTLLSTDRDGVRVEVVAHPSDKGVTDYSISCRIQEPGQARNFVWLGISYRRDLAAHQYALLPVIDGGLVCLVHKIEPLLIRVLFQRGKGVVWPPEGNRDAAEPAARRALDAVRRELGDSRYELG